MNATERRAVTSLSAIFGLRMLGLFMVLPVLAVFARDMPGATPALVGLAMGMYGLTQAILQIPFGYLSDRFGRKRVIAVGLLVFAAGSLVAGLSDTIYGIIAGRALQGAGAIAAAVLALTADLTREQQRTKAMAAIGMSIGAAFLVAMMIAPVLEGWIGVAGIFWVIAVLPVLMLPVLWWYTPDPAHMRRDTEVEFSVRLFRRIFADRQLLRLDIGIFALHLALTALFAVIPQQLVDVAGMASNEHWKIYVPVMLSSIVGMVPLLIIAHKRHLYRSMTGVAITAMIVAEAVFGSAHGSLVYLVVGLWLFFVGFNALEAMLPAMVSRLAPPGTKGTVLGIYNTFEFAGIFVGGLAGGWAYGAFGPAGSFLLVSAALAVWLVLVVTAPPLRLLDSITLLWQRAAARDAEGLLRRLTSLPGVEDGTAVPADGLVYLKVDPSTFDPSSVDAFPELSRA